MSLTFTGERFLTECQGEMVYEHWHRYLIAKEHAAGKRVLDVASGEGYGSHLMASVAASVVGVDLSEDAVRHANEKYARPNLRYIAASCTQIPLPDASFDFIVSFETIEHIHEQAAFLDEVKRLLAPGGVFLVSSPNRPEYSDKTGYKNEYHVKELDQAELRDQLSSRWSSFLWAGQRAAFHSIVWPIDRKAQLNSALTVEGESGFPVPMYFLVFCADRPESLASIPAALTLVADRENSVYAEWSRTYRENEQLRAEVLKLRETNATLSGEAAALTASPAADPHSSIGSSVPNAREHWLIRAARRLVG